MLSLSTSGGPARTIVEGEVAALFGGSVTVELPVGWVVVNDPHEVAGSSVLEIGDDEVLVALAGRPFGGGAELLMAELLGTGHGGDGATHDRSVRGIVRWTSDGGDEQLVAAVVLTPPDGGHAIALEVVADGPSGAVAQRLPAILAIVASARSVG